MYTNPIAERILAIFGDAAYDCVQYHYRTGQAPMVIDLCNVKSVERSSDGRILVVETSGRTIFVDLADVSTVIGFKVAPNGHKKLGFRKGTVYY